jgi:hypothetical protein
VKYVRSTNPHTATSQKDSGSFLISQLGCATLRARLAACEIDSIGVALRGGLIDPETAVAWLHDCGVLNHVTPGRAHGGAP